MAQRGLVRWAGCGGLVLLACTTLAAPPTIDGQNIPSDFAGGMLLATQRFQTGFGDDQSGDQFGFGSELNQLFVTNDDQFLYIGLTGNLENNGNSMMVFIDVDGASSGAHTLVFQDFGVPVPGLPRYLAGQTGEQGLTDLTFDPNFAPDYIIGWSGGSPIGSQTRTYYLVNWTQLDPVDQGINHTNTIVGLITAGDPTASGPTPGTLGSFLSSADLGILAAADNSNTAGVEGGFPPGIAQSDPASATTGFELAIPLSLMNVSAGDTICMLALVSSPNGYISNQLLPTDNDPNRATFDNLGFPPHDLGNPTVAAGDQFACYTIQAGGGCPQPGCEGADIAPPGGDCVIDLADLSTLLSNFGTPSGATFDQGDLDGDGDVDLSDLSTMLQAFGTDCN